MDPADGRYYDICCTPADDVRQCEVVDEGDQPMMAAMETISEASRRIKNEDGSSDTGVTDSSDDDSDAESFTLEMFHSLMNANVQQDGRRLQTKSEQTSKSAHVEAPAREAEKTPTSGGISAALKTRISDMAQAAKNVKHSHNVVVDMEEEAKNAKMDLIVHKKPNHRSPEEVDSLAQWLKTTDRMYAMEMPVLRNFARALELVEYQNGGRVFGVGDRADFFYVVYKGTCDQVHDQAVQDYAHQENALGGLQKPRVTMGGKLFNRRRVTTTMGGVQKQATTLVPKCGFGDKAIMGNFAHCCVITCTSHVLVLRTNAQTFKDVMIGKVIKHEITYRIQELPELMNVEDAVLETFAHAFVEVRFRSGQIICRQGGRGQGPHAHVFWVTSGTVKCCADPLHDPSNSDASTPTEDLSSLVTLSNVTSGGLVGDSALRAGYYARSAIAATPVTALRVEVCDVLQRFPSFVVNNMLRAADSKLEYQRQRSEKHLSAALGGLFPDAQLAKAYCHMAISKHTQISRGYSLCEFKNLKADTVKVPKDVRTSIFRDTRSKACFLELRPHSPADVWRSQQEATPLSALSALSALSTHVGCILSPPSSLSEQGRRLSMNRVSPNRPRKSPALPVSSPPYDTKDLSSSLRGTRSWTNGISSKVVLNQKASAYKEQGRRRDAATCMSARSDYALVHSAMPAGYGLQTPNHQ